MWSDMCQQIKGLRQCGAVLVASLYTAAIRHPLSHIGLEPLWAQSPETLAIPAYCTKHLII